MATTTTNNGWTIPQSTDLVTNGATAIATLGNNIDTSVSKGLLAWQSYTPTWTGVTKGTSPTEYYRYCQVGKTVHFRIALTLGTSGAVTGGVNVTLPVTAHASILRSYFNAYLYDNGVSNYAGYGIATSTTSMDVYVIAAGGTYAALQTVSATVPHTWGSTDSIWIQGTYEAA